MYFSYFIKQSILEAFEELRKLITLTFVYIKQTGVQNRIKTDKKQIINYFLILLLPYHVNCDDINSKITIANKLLLFIHYV